MEGYCMPEEEAKVVRALPGNNVCADCSTRNPSWASVSHGSLVCLECSGKHRGLGVHISFVRSVDMDSWSEKQLQLMRHGGNDKLNGFLREKGLPLDSMSVSEKYHSPYCQLYRDRLLAEVEGRPLPTEPPVQAVSATSIPSDADRSTIQRLPGETDEQYIARQRENKARAQERIQSSGRRMEGLGSDTAYDPSTGTYRGFGGGSSGSGINFDEWSSSLSSSFAQVRETASQTFQSIQQSEVGQSVSRNVDKVREQINSSQLASDVKKGAGEGWDTIRTQTQSGWDFLRSSTESFWTMASEQTKELSGALGLDQTHPSEQQQQQQHQQ
jgi:ADP-ribosylation factor GTPase-activating protein 1